MSNQQRASLGLSDEQEQIDLEQLTGAGYRTPPTPEQQQKFMAAGAASGFISRQPAVRRRKRSPYNAQFGGKCRAGMKELFQEVADRMDLYDTQTLEAAILALIEKEGFDDLKQQFKELVG